MLSLQALFIFAEVAHSANAHNIHGTHLTPRQAEWGYLGETGPLRWGGICSTGNRQSPTVLDSSIPRSTIHPVASYTDVASANITNTGKTLETAVTGTINYPYKGLSANWKLLQFHFHTPSEHRILEEYFPLEMHLVHELQDSIEVPKPRFVIAILFQLSENGTTTDLITAAIQNLNNLAPGSAALTGPLRFANLALAIRTGNALEYPGSLTTPPCSESVTWFVKESPLLVDVKSYNALKQVMKFNSRYTQNILTHSNLLRC